MNDDLLEAREYVDNENYNKAWPIVSKVLNDEPDNPQALCVAAFMLEKQKNPALAYQLLKRVTQMFPSNPTGWLNLGKTCDSLWKMDEAESAYKRALSNLKAGDDETRQLVYNNLAAMFLQMGRFKEARQWSEKSLKLNPEALKARHNLGISLLAEGDWKDGLKQYEASVGSPQRPMFKYADEPLWRGEKNAVVAIYGEQGIGDEICAASMFNDAIHDAKKVIIDCDSRLEGIFRRSFPRARVYGTRTQKVLNWPEEDQQIDYSIPSMQLGGIYRLSADKFDGKPYLVADPERVTMWKALWATKEKPILGIAWSGGIKETASKFRIWNHEQMATIMRTVDAHWVSLQYKDAADEIREFKAKYPDIDIRQYEYATLTRDYDDMCGLVASLDGVVAMQSSAVHTAGALGVPCAAGIPITSQWRYGSHGDKLPWYQSVTMFRQTEYTKWNLEGIKAWILQSLSS